MNRIDDLIRNPGIYYDDKAMDGFVQFCEKELTLTDGSDLKLLETFKLWAEEIFGWYYFEERTVYKPNPDGHGGRYVQKRIKHRLVRKQYLIVARGAAKSMYDSCVQQFFLTVDPATTQQLTTAPTMKQAEEVLSPMRTAIARARGPLYRFMTEGSLQNTTGSKAARTKLASTKKGMLDLSSQKVRAQMQSRLVVLLQCEITGNTPSAHQSIWTATALIQITFIIC